MLGPLQGGDEIVIHAPSARIFDILQDSTRLPDWTSVVATTGTTEAVGVARECDVNLEGKLGSVVERCIELDRPRRIAWAMERDTFGFSRLLTDFGFSFTLSPAADGRTLVRNETYYRPRGAMGAVMNALMIRRKFRNVRRGFLSNLKRVSEEVRVSRSA